jgi:hypothetical protein
VNPLLSFYFQSRTRREIALSPCAILRGLRVFCPYMDEDVAAFFGSLPASFVLGHTFHDDAIARAFPEFADIPYETRVTSGVAPLPGWEMLWNDLRSYFRETVRPRILRGWGVRAMGEILPLLHGPTGYPLANAFEKLVCLAEMDAAVSPQA